MTIRTYSSPESFKQALEQRLRTSAKSGAEFARKRRRGHPRFRRHRTADAAPLPDRDAPRREAARLHDAAVAPELAGERPPRHRPARDRAAHRRPAPARRSRADLHVPQDARAPREGARAARRLDDALRSDGARRPAGVAHSRRSDHDGPDLPRSRPRRSVRCNVGAREVELATSPI